MADKTAAGCRAPREERGEVASWTARATATKGGLIHVCATAQSLRSSLWLANSAWSRRGNGRSSTSFLELHVPMRMHFDRAFRRFAKRSYALVRKLRGRISTPRNFHGHRLARHEVAVTADEILAWFREHNPKTLTEINAAGIETAPMGDGSDQIAGRAYPSADYPPTTHPTGCALKARSARQRVDLARLTCEQRPTYLVRE